MRSRKPAIPLSLLIALLSSLVFALSACEQTGFTPSVQSRSTDQPTVDSESSVREMSQPPSESTRGASEIAGEPVGNEPVPGGMLTVTFLNVGQGSSALIRLPNGGKRPNRWRSARWRLLARSEHVDIYRGAAQPSNE